MGIGPLELSGGVTRVQDFANMRHTEENKPAVDQVNFSNQFQREVRDRNETVKRGNDTTNNQKRFDAREKGSNEYEGDGGKRRNTKKGSNQGGNVSVKGSTSSFDVRI